MPARLRRLQRHAGVAFIDQQGDEAATVITHNITGPGLVLLHQGTTVWVAMRAWRHGGAAVEVQHVPLTEPVEEPEESPRQILVENQVPAERESRPRRISIQSAAVPSEDSEALTERGDESQLPHFFVRDQVLHLFLKDQDLATQALPETFARRRPWRPRPRWHPDEILLLDVALVHLCLRFRRAQREHFEEWSACWELRNPNEEDLPHAENESGGPAPTEPTVPSSGEPLPREGTNAYTMDFLTFENVRFLDQI